MSEVFPPVHLQSKISKFQIFVWFFLSISTLGTYETVLIYVPFEPRTKKKIAFLISVTFIKVKPTLKPCWDRYIGYHYWAKSFHQYICKVRFYPDLGNKHLHSHHYWFCKHFLCNFVFRWHKLEYPLVNHQVSWWFLSNCLRCVCLLDKLLLVASLSSKWIDGQPEK